MLKVFAIVAILALSGCGPPNYVTTKTVVLTLHSTTKYTCSSKTRIILHRNWRKARRPGTTSEEPAHGCKLEYSLDGQSFKPFDSESVSTFSESWDIPVVHVEAGSSVWIRLTEKDPSDMGKKLTFQFTEPE